MKTDPYEDAGRLMVEQLQKFIKKIPIRGLNNMTKAKYLDGYGFHVSPEGSLWTIPPKPTLPRRMEKLFWGRPYLPPQMVAMGATKQNHKDEAKKIIIECFKKLNNLESELDKVNVIKKYEIIRYKTEIKNLKSYLRKPGIILGAIQETSFTLSNSVKPLIREIAHIK